MLVFAKNELVLSKRQPDGASLRQHLQSAQRQIGRMPEHLQELTAVKCPPALVFVWQAFLELSAARGSTGVGPAPISYSELQAWAALTRRNVTAWQVELIKRLDALYLNHQDEAEKSTGENAHD